MIKSSFSHELRDLSFESLEETNRNINWCSLVKILTYEQLESLRTVFENSIKDNSLDKEEFLNAITDITGDQEHSSEASALFDDVTHNQHGITWDDFLDFLLENIPVKTNFPVYLHVESVESFPNVVNRETIAKIVLIESEKYFCYAVVSKYGRVTIYDGNLEFLTYYHVLMTREDLERSEEDRRKNRWVTDAIFCLDIQMFFIANSTRSIAIYEASGLKHVPYWLIIGVRDIVECLTYKELHQKKADDKSRSILLAGTSRGDVIAFKFLQPETTLLRKKHSDKLTVFYWDELIHENQYLKIKFFENIHKSNVEQIDYSEKEDAILTCSKDPVASLVKKYISINKSPYIFKIKKVKKVLYRVLLYSTDNALLQRALVDKRDAGNRKGTYTILNIIVTGSDDKIIRVWNSSLVSHTIAAFFGHQAKIIDLVIIENQQVLLSFSEDGILKLWEINDSKCLQTIGIRYPCFGILGKFIEFGRKNIYPGSKRHTDLSLVRDDHNLYKKYFGISQVEERPTLTEDIKSKYFNKWERSNVLVTCCNHIAIIKTTFENTNIENFNKMPILPSPPLQNSVLIPAGWQISMKDRVNESEVSEAVGEKIPEDLNFIINKDLFDIEGSRSDVNYKIAILEAKKMKMKAHVENGAPYLALDLAEFEELKLTDNMLIPENKEVRHTIDNIKKHLENVYIRDRAFSEPSSSRSKKSSRSSIISIM